MGEGEGTDLGGVWYKREDVGFCVCIVYLKMYCYLYVIDKIYKIKLCLGFGIIFKMSFLLIKVMIE